MKTPYKIPKERYNDLLTKVEKLNKRAKKLNLPDVTVEITSEYSYTCSNILIPMLEIEIDGISPKIDGWEFIAKLVFDPIIGKNIIYKINDAITVPTEYLTSNSCDHCKTNARRINTFILKQEDTFIQVGSSCLKDFFNADIESIVASISTLLSDMDEMENIDEFSSRESFSKGKTMIKLITYMEHIAMMIRLDGSYRKDWEY